jgi:hypothetical protein
MSLSEYDSIQSNELGNTVVLHTHIYVCKQT